MCDINLYERFKKDIEKFYAEDEEVWQGSIHHNRDRNAFVWIARHPSEVGGRVIVETLTVEPEECGGQHEIAVRWKNEDGEWAGYHITEDGYMIGVNTDGH